MRHATTHAMKRTLIALLLGLTVFSATGPALADDCPDFSGTFAGKDPTGREVRIQFELRSCEELGRKYLYADKEIVQDLVTDGIFHQPNPEALTGTLTQYVGPVLRTQTIWFATDPEGNPALRGRISEYELLENGDLKETVRLVDGQGNSSSDLDYLYLREWD